ncbi:MAG: hypothetical protein ACOVKO_00825 [Elstera sp.]
MQAVALKNRGGRSFGRRTLLDTTRLAELRDILSPCDLRKLIGDVISVVQNCTRAIRSTRGRAGDDTLRNAYDLYGTAANFGLMPLAFAAERVVSSAKTGQDNDLSAQARELVSVGETTVEALLVWIDQAAPEKAA